MGNHENRASGPTAPGHEHEPAPGHEDHSTTIGAGSQSAGCDTSARDRLTARDRSTGVATEVIAHTAKLAGQASEQVSRLMAAQKNRTADGLHRLACALRDTTQSREQNEVGGRISTYADRAAARMEVMSTYMRETEFPTMLRDAGQFARRRPEVLLAGTVLMGLLVAKLLQNSRRRPADPWTSATGRLHAAVQKGTHAVSAAADTLKQGAEAQYAAIASNRRRAAEKLTGSNPADLYRRVARWSRRRIA
jgi:hypothetical protein